MAKKRRSNGAFWGLISIPIAIIIACVIIGVSVTEYKKSPYNTSTPFILVNRLANNNDFILDESNVFSFSPHFVLRSKYNIDDLIIKIGYYNKDDKLIYSVQKDIGDVKSGIDYKIPLKLSDIPFSHLTAIDHSSIDVVRGLVFRFQKKVIFV